MQQLCSKPDHIQGNRPLSMHRAARCLQSLLPSTLYYCFNDYANYCPTLSTMIVRAHCQSNYMFSVLIFNDSINSIIHKLYVFLLSHYLQGNNYSLGQRLISFLFISVILRINYGHTNLE